jgi:hypothetical protein
MGRMKIQEPVSTGPTSLVASAARIRGGTSMGLYPRNTSADAWHQVAWERYRTIGEFRYACDWIGAQLSKAILYGTVETENGVEKIADGGVVEYLGQLFGNADGRAEMLRLIGIHMAVTGECWIVAYPDPDPYGDGGDKWEVAASTKCIRPATDSERWKVNDVYIEVPASDVMAIRIWRPDPLEPQLSISPARAVLSTLHQLHKLGQYVSAQIDSRLAGAGILLMPTTMSFPAPAVEGPKKEGETQIQKSASSAEDLMHVIMQAMAASIQNRDDASSMVPIVITASAEDIEAVKHMTFWSELDAQAIELRKEAIQRLALGMDMPAEVLQGAADANHWSAWQADESAIKAHTEPLLKIITTALGSHYLRPLLSEDPDFDGERLAAYSVAADTSEMRLRPNRGKEALELYNLGELSGVALRRETGFDENDAMDEEELARWFTRKVAAGSTTPELVEAALKELGVTLTVVRPDAPAADTGTDGRPAPSTKDYPVQDIPDRNVSEQRKIARGEGRVPSSDIARKASLFAASDQLVLRALERAGNRLKNKLGGLKVNCSASELYQYVGVDDVEFALTDAWGYVPRTAEQHGLDPEELTAELHEYTADLLRTQTAHSYDRLEAFMTRELESAA